MKKFKKKGKSGMSETGEPVLVNEEGQTFRADRVAILIWDKCDGNVTFEDLVKEIRQKTKQGESTVRRGVELLVGDMEKGGLVESIE